MYNKDMRREEKQYEELKSMGMKQKIKAIFAALSVAVGYFVFLVIGKLLIVLAVAIYYMVKQTLIFENALQLTTELYNAGIRNNISYAIAVIFSIMILLVLRRDARIELYKGLHDNKMRGKDILRLGVIAVLAAFVVNSIINLVCCSDEILPEGKSDIIADMVRIGISCMIVPIAEEIVFRGLAFGRLAKAYSKQTAIICSALIFAVGHGNLEQGIYTFFMGLLFAFLYCRYKTIGAPIIVHMIFNMVPYLFLGHSLDRQIVYVLICLCAVMEYVLIKSVWKDTRGMKNEILFK